ncbi:MAG: hypothetical protein ACYDCL_03665 [Myxococcales bacterium]
MRTLRPWLPLLLAPLSCGGLSLRVSPDSVHALPVDERLDLLDAENDLFAALDRRDDAVQALDDARDAYARTKRQLSAAGSDLDKAEDERDSQGVAIGKLAVDEAKAHRRWADRAIDLARDQLDIASAYVLVAEAQFEKAKAEAVVRAKVKGASKISVPDYAAQVKRFRDRARSVERDLKEDTVAAEKIRSRWAELSRKLSELTGGAQGSPWVE